MISSALMLLAKHSAHALDAFCKRRSKFTALTVGCYGIRAVNVNQHLDLSSMFLIRKNYVGRGGPGLVLREGQYLTLGASSNVLWDFAVSLSDLNSHPTPPESCVCKLRFLKILRASPCDHPL
jgi:hypothetical protein